jgi:YfiH family protein
MVSQFFERRVSDSGLPYWVWPPLGVRHGFSTRMGGVSEGAYASLNLAHAVGDRESNVAVNRERWTRALELSCDCVTVRQVHGDRVVDAQEVAGGPACEADALTSNVPSLPIGVMTADCAAILLHAPNVGIVAAVHAGWRGTVAEIVVQSIQWMCRKHGATASAMRAAIGPAIGPCCFDIGPDVADRIRLKDWGAKVLTERNDRCHMDLVEANVQQMVAMGLSRSAIGAANQCTRCASDHFFSYRGSGGLTGRMLATVTNVPDGSS